MYAYIQIVKLKYMEILHTNSRTLLLSGWGIFATNFFLQKAKVSSGIHQNTRGINLIVTLGFCKAHYETYAYFIHFNRSMCSPLTEIQFLILESRL